MKSSELTETRMLRFTGAIQHDRAIDEWFNDRPGELGSIAHRWFSRMRECGGDVRELVHDGCPTVCVEDAPFAYANVFKAHVNIGFFHGASLPDPARLLEGDGKYMRHVKLKPGLTKDASALDALVTAAYLDIKARLKAG